MDKGIVVHVLVRNNDGEILLIKRSEQEDVLPGFWDIPGGTLEDGEDPKDGALREAREETGLEVNDLRLFHYTSDVDQEKDKQFVRLIFAGRSISPEVRLNKEDHSEYKWVSVRRIPDDMGLVDYIRPVINSYLREV